MASFDLVCSVTRTVIVTSGTSGCSCRRSPELGCLESDPRPIRATSGREASVRPPRVTGLTFSPDRELPVTRCLGRRREGGGLPSDSL